MAYMSVIALLVLLLHVLLTVTLVAVAFAHRLLSTGFHGPPSYPVVGCLPSFYANRHRLLEWYTQLLSTSPTLTIIVHRLGAPRTVITTNPCNVRHILADNFANFPKGKQFSDILGDLLGFGIFNVDGSLWGVQRKLASHHFSTSSLRNHVISALQRQINRRLIPALESAAEAGDVIDLQDVLKRFAFDIVCQVTLGVDPESLNLSLDPPPLAVAFDVASGISAARAAAPVFAVWKVKRMLNMGSERRLKEAIQIVHQSVVDIMRRKKLDQDYGRSGRSDLLSQLLVAGHEEEAVRDTVISFIMAGRDTTSSAMTWLFWLLSHHRDVEDTLIREFTALPIEHDADAGDVLDKLKGMKFAKACLSESMRLYPPVAWDSKHAAGDDVLPDGTRVKKGDRVTYFPYGMGRMESLWGKDKLEFRPDRWITDVMDGTELKRVNPYSFPVFQAGPRVCLGKEMAYLQMKYVVASVLPRFVIRSVKSEAPRFLPLLTAQMAGGLNVLVTKREDGAFKFST